MSCNNVVHRIALLSTIKMRDLFSYLHSKIKIHWSYHAYKTGNLAFLAVVAPSSEARGGRGWT